MGQVCPKTFGQEKTTENGAFRGVGTPKKVRSRVGCESSVSGKPQHEVAHDLGIGVETLRDWKQQPAQRPTGCGGRYQHRDAARSGA